MAPGKRGRPNLDPLQRASAAVSTRLTIPEVDRLYAQARQERLTLAAYLRRALRRDLARGAPGAPTNDDQ